MLHFPPGSCLACFRKRATERVRGRRAKSRSKLGLTHWVPTQIGPAGMAPWGGPTLKRACAHVLGPDSPAEQLGILEQLPKSAWWLPRRTGFGRAPPQEVSRTTFMCAVPHGRPPRAVFGRPHCSPWAPEPAPHWRPSAAPCVRDMQILLCRSQASTRGDEPNMFGCEALEHEGLCWGNGEA